jgi:hypothetical protein
LTFPSVMRRVRDRSFKFEASTPLSRLLELR